MANEQPSTPTAHDARAAGRLKKLLDDADRGAKSKLGRRLIEEGYDSGEQLPRKYAAGSIAFGRAQQRLLARLIREEGIAQIPDNYFETDDAAAPTAGTRHPSLARVLAIQAYHAETVRHLLEHDRSMDLEDDPGEQLWLGLGAVIETAYAAADARRAKPRGGRPSRRR